MLLVFVCLVVCPSSSTSTSTRTKTTHAEVCIETRISTRTACLIDTIDESQSLPSTGRPRFAPCLTRTKKRKSLQRVRPEFWSQKIRQCLQNEQYRGVRRAKRWVKPHKRRTVFKLSYVRCVTRKGRISRPIKTAATNKNKRNAVCETLGQATMDRSA